MPTDYVLTTCEHRIDQASGYITEVTNELPPPTAPRRGAEATLAVVKDVDDPEHRARVKVALSAYEGVETHWFPVVLPGAGADKGLVVLPNVGDTVVVLLPGGDGAHGIVLGGLYPDTRVPDDGVHRGSVKRFHWTSRAGHNITIDDGDSSLKVETASGDRLELTPDHTRLTNADGSFIDLGVDEVRLHANRNLVMEAPGKGIRIRADRIDFERA